MAGSTCRRLVFFDPLGSLSIVDRRTDTEALPASPYQFPFGEVPGGSASEASPEFPQLVGTRGGQITRNCWSSGLGGGQGRECAGTRFDR
jgi:hypothetical protein